uniref:Interferon phi 4 n=1 Tax=Mastacembelus armatus TaxID=205130 RepID=A0A7N8XJM7_9TELE
SHRVLKMLSRVFFVCLFLGLYSAGSSLSCRWMDHKFGQYSKNYLDLLNTMVSEAEVDTVAFPSDLYSQAEDKLGFTVQILEEVALLFEKDHSSASWDSSTVENFLNIVTMQANSLHSCVSLSHKKKNKKLHMYFKRLSHHVLERMGHSAEAWELIRKEIQTHLMRTDLLVSSLQTAN